MGFQVVKTFVVGATPDAVWQFLIDPRRVAGCLPGAAITNQVDEKTYTGTMTIKVGPVTTSYKGKVVFQRLDAEAKVAEIVASGQDVKGKGGANMKLSSAVVEVSPGKSEITATSDVSVTGILAQMGRGMIQDVSDELFQIFSQRVRAELESGAGDGGPASRGPSGGAAGPAPLPGGGSTAGSQATAASAPIDAGLAAAAPLGAPAAITSSPPPTAAVMPTAAATAAAAATPTAAAPPNAAATPAAAATPNAAATPIDATPPPEVALDLGAIGARAARRAALRLFTRPAFWIAVAVVVVAAYALIG